MGIVYGYATNETSEYLPLPYVLATRIIFEINQMTRKHQLKGLCFDTKCQVSIYYDENNFPVQIDNIILSIQHKKDVNLDSLFNKIVMRILKPLAKKYKMNTDFKITFNNGGNFILGGPFADTGLTGRKLMVDTYGTIAHHGGGAFSGKDYTKIDRTGAYFARFIAKNMVANNFADRMEVQLVYNIGDYTPTSIYINCFGTEKCQIQKIYKIVNKTFDFELSNIVKKFDLEKFDFTKTSIYGHFTNLNSNSNYP
jgi:S-adenosylmethionine synthetase